MATQNNPAPHVFRLIPPAPIDIVRSEGMYSYNAAGQAYLDFESGCWATSLGHQHPATLAALHHQSQQVIHLGTRYPNTVVENTALELLSICGIDQGQCFFLVSGSEAVEFAVQAACQCSRKPHLLVLSGSYMAAFGTSNKLEAPQWVTLDWQTCETCQGQDCTQCSRLDALDFSRIGAFVFESGSYAGQVKFPPAALIKEIAGRIKDHDGLIVCNEITAGMGRTGKWFGYQHYDLQPDLVAAGKGLGSGYPVSAVVMTQTVADTLHNSGMKYAQSHQNDPLGAAVAIAVIRTMRDENLLENCRIRGAQLMQGLCEIKSRYPVITAVRGRGLLVAVQCHDDSSAAAIYARMLENHILIGYKPNSNILRFFPALNVHEEEIVAVLQALDKCLISISQNIPSIEGIA